MLKFGMLAKERQWGTHQKLESVHIKVQDLSARKIQSFGLSKTCDPLATILNLHEFKRGSV